MERLASSAPGGTPLDGELQQQAISFAGLHDLPQFDAAKAREESLALDSLLGLSSAPPLRSLPMHAPGPAAASMPPPASTIVHYPQQQSQPPPLHAPRPHHAFQPNLDWATPNLDPPPPPQMHHVALATPSWTALFPSSSAQSSAPNLFAPSPFSPSAPPQQPTQAPIRSSSGSGTSSPYPFQSQPSALFALPPTTTLYNDVDSAIAASAAPSAFYSSYGLYQPIQGPYARFLTPSPEPSVLGDFELDLELGGGSGGAKTGGETSTSRNGGDTSGSMWTNSGTTPASSGNGISPAGTSGDLFEGMAAMGQSRPRPERAESYESSTMHDAPPRPPTLPSFGALSTLAGAATYSAANGRRQSGASDDPFQQLQQHMQSYSQFSSADSTPAPVDIGRGGWPATIDEDPTDSAAPSGPSSRAGSPKPGLTKSGKPRKARKPKAAAAADVAAVAVASSTTAASTDPSATTPTAANSAETSPEDVGNADAGPLKGGGKKNRNPHATQLPGNGTRKLPKPEAEEGHEGPMCTHCSSIATPLWRRGPDDELLCNACGLYQKLHGKPRPRAFAKQPASAKRSSNSAAAQAAASGVPPSCFNCAATSTPMWRKDPEGNLCCNACSLYYKLHNVVRPASLAHKRKSTAGSTTTNPSTRRNSIDHDSSQQASPNLSPRINSSLALPSLAAAAAAAAEAASSSHHNNLTTWEFDPPPSTTSPQFHTPTLPPAERRDEQEIGSEFSLPVTSYAGLSWRAITPSDGYSSNANSRAPSPEPRKRQRFDGDEEGGMDEEKAAPVVARDDDSRMDEGRS